MEHPAVKPEKSEKMLHMKAIFKKSNIVKGKKSCGLIKFCKPR